MTRLVHVLSMILFVVHLLAPCCMGQSPDGALAAESVHRLKGILKNCEFAGVIRNDDVRVIDSDSEGNSMSLHGFVMRHS